MKPGDFVSWLALGVCLLLMAGCGTVSTNPTVLGGCHVPAKLNYDAPGPAPLQSVDTPLATHLQDDAHERSAHAGLAKDFNELRAHVKGC